MDDEMALQALNKGMRIPVLKIMLCAYHFEFVTCTYDEGRKIKLAFRLMFYFYVFTTSFGSAVGSAKVS